MAILGFQVISTLIGASILSKIITKSTFIVGYLCKNLYHFMSPNDDIIMELANLSKVKPKSKKSKGQDSHSEEFFFPRETKIPLMRVKVKEFDISHLPMYTDLVWLCDFSFCAILIYAANEVFSSFGFSSSNSDMDENSSKSLLLKVVDTSKIRVNLSLVWLSITIFYSFLVLKKILGIFLKKPKTSNEKTLSPEAIIVLSVSFIFFILNFFFLTFDKKLLDFKLNQLHSSIAVNESIVPTTMKVIFTKEKTQIFLSLFGSLMSSLFIFPGMRFGRMFLDTMRFSSTGLIAKFFNILNFLFPLFIMLLWFVPFTNYFLPIFLSSCSVLVTSSGLTFLIKSILTLIEWTKLENLGSFRVSVTFVYLLLRLIMLKSNIQAYLEIARDTSEKIQKEPGKISNFDFKKTINNIFCCFNLIVSQYIAPLLISFCFLSLYKNCSGLSWMPCYALKQDRNETIPNFQEAIDKLVSSESDSYLDTIMFTRNHFYMILDSMRLQGHLLSDCIFGYLLWSSVMTWFIINIVGVLYYQYAD